MPLSAELNSASALSRSLLSVRNNDGRIVGLAFLVTDTVAFTCAHVINTATGRSRTEDATGATVELETVFGPSEGTVVEATVEHWSAATSPRQAADDISVLRLQHSVEATEPVRLQNPSGPHGEAQVRVFGMPAGRPQGVWHAGTLKGMVASGWIQINQSADTGYRIEQGFSGGPVWDEAQRAVVGMITVADLGEVRAAYAIPAPSLIAALPALRDELRQPSPYPGLIPYPETMRDAFLGRGMETRAVANLLDQERWVTISGPSGSGKSSLLLAGIVPLLRDCGDQVIVVRPGEDDWPSLANHLGGQAHENRTVVAIDQLEELFTLDEEGQDSFIQTLFGDRVSSRVRVVSTLRHDFLGLALAHPVLRRAVQGGQRMYPLGPLQEEGLRAVVTRAGARVSVPRYEHGLADRIVADARASAAPMPLLSHTLATLWDGSPGSILTHRAYDEAGGVGGALDQAVRRWLDEVPVDLEKHLPHLLAKLVRLTSETADPTRRAVNAAELSGPERELARRLTTAGLLVAGGSLDPPSLMEESSGHTVLVELAHDSLFRIWGPLHAFIEENRSFLVWSERLRIDAERWARSDRERGELLPSEAELDAAARWEQERDGDLTPAQREYLAAGRAARAARARRRHWVLGSAAIVAALFLVLATVLIASGVTSAEQRQRAASRVLAENAAELKSTDPSLGILASVAAWQTAPTDEARDRLLSEYVDYLGTGYARVLPTGLGTPNVMAHSADGDVVAVISAYERLTLEVNVVSGPIRTAEITDQSRIQAVAVSADGSRVVAFREDGTAFWFAIDRSVPSLHGPVHTLQNAKTRVPTPADESDPSQWEWNQRPLISPDGRYAVARVWDRFVRWDLRSDRITDVVPASADTLFDFWASSPDAGTLIMPLVLGPNVDRPDAVELNLKTGKSRVIARGGEWLLSGNAKVLIRCRDHGSSVEYARFRVADGAQIGKPISYDVSTCLMEGTDRTGRFLLADAGGGMAADGEAVIDFGKGAVTSDFAVPNSWLGATAGETLAERDGKYYQLGAPTNDGPAGYITVPTSTGPTLGSDNAPFTSQLLLGRGDRSVGITDQSALGATSADELIQLRSTEYPGQLITQTEVRVPGWTIGARDGPRATPRGELVADREGRNVVVIRDAATLQKRAVVYAERPPDNDSQELSLVRDLSGNSGATAAYDNDGFSYFFDASGNLVTVSGDVVQLWRAWTGRQVARLDLSKTRPPGAGNALPSVAPSSSPETVSVTYPGALSTTVINVSSGRSVGNLPTGPLTVSVQADQAGKYLLLYRQDHTVEVRDSRARRTILGPVQAGKDNQFVARFLGSDRFLLGADNSVRVYDLRSGIQTDSFRFGGQVSQGSVADPTDPLGTVQAVSSDGERVIYQRAEGPPLVIPLDAGQWQRSLCAVAGYRRLGGELDYLTPGTRIRRDVCGQAGS